MSMVIYADGWQGGGGDVKKVSLRDDLRLN